MELWRYVTPFAQLAAARPDDVLGMGEPEGHEQQTWLVDVAVVLVDDHDRCLVEGVHATQPVRRQRATRATAEDHDAMCHDLIERWDRSPCQGRRS